MTEMAIQQLLADAGATDVDRDLVMVEPRGLEVPADWAVVRSPETYLGHRPGDRVRVARRAPRRRAVSIRRAGRGCA